MHSVLMLDPGQGVTITDKTDPNYRRDGFVRESTPGHYHPTQDTNGYKVWFEPGEKDYKYRGTQLEPNSEYMDPTKMPKGEKQ